MKVIVAGTNYGRQYLLALRLVPGLECVGLLCRGAAHSIALAEAVGIPAYLTVSELPEDVRIAFVAVRSPSSVALSESLLCKGISVCTEHPFLPSKVPSLLDLAAENAAAFAVNNDFVGLAKISEFTKRIRGGCNVGPITSIYGTCSLRRLYAWLDLLSCCLGRRPMTHISVTSSDPVSITARFGVIPLTLNCLADRSAHEDVTLDILNFSMTISTPAHAFALLAPWGPIVRTTTISAATAEPDTPLSNVIFESVTLNDFMMQRVLSTAESIGAFRESVVGQPIDLRWSRDQQTWLAFTWDAMQASLGEVPLRPGMPVPLHREESDVRIEPTRNFCEGTSHGES